MYIDSNYVILDFLLVVGITLNVVVILSLFRSNLKELHGKLLIPIFLTTTLSILFSYAYLHNIRWLLILTWIFIQTSAWYLGPLLLLYIKSLYLPSQGLVRRNILHFLPAFLIVIFISFPSLKSILDEEYLFSYIYYIMEKGRTLIEIVQILFLGFYCFLSLRELNHSKKHIKKESANLKNLDLKWIYLLLAGLIIICHIDLATSIFELFLYELPFSSGYLTIGALALLISYLAINGLMHSRMLLPDPLSYSGVIINDNNCINISEKKNLHSDNQKLSSKEIAEIKHKLNLYLDIQKAYKDQKLTLGLLATKMNISQRKVSIFLNQHLECSFFALINKKRVEEVKNIIDSGKFKHFTLLAIGLKAGFNSKTTFYRAFKNITGMAPSEYNKLK